MTPAPIPCPLSSEPRELRAGDVVHVEALPGASFDPIVVAPRYLSAKMSPEIAALALGMLSSPPLGDNDSWSGPTAEECRCILRSRGPGRLPLLDDSICNATVHRRDLGAGPTLADCIARGQNEHEHARGGLLRGAWIHPVGPAARRIRALEAENAQLRTEVEALRRDKAELVKAQIDWRNA